MLARVMNPLFRLLVVNCVSGAILAFGFVGGLLALNVAQLRTLMLADGEGLLALALLTFGFIVTCCSVMMGSAVMSIWQADAGGGHAPPQAEAHAAARRP
jgi:ABC-type uncharacterized transport system permease subunit